MHVCNYIQKHILAFKCNTAYLLPTPHISDMFYTFILLFYTENESDGYF